MVLYIRVSTDISIHALLAESDADHSGEVSWWFYFYPRSPCGERHHQSLNLPSNPIISIHALLAESDVKLFRQNYECFISIHALLAESDFFQHQFFIHHSLFLSTLSLRRATAYPDMIICTNVISIHALLAESDLRVVDGSKSSIISIHALLAESDFGRAFWPGLSY